MTKFIKVTEPTVAIKAQGHVATVDATTFHEDAINAIFAYGLRRWFQDNINSQAKTLRDGDDDVDVQALFNARLDQALTGEITMRNGEPSDPLETYIAQVARARMDAAAKAAYNAIDSVDQKARREFLVDLASVNPTWISIAMQVKDADEARKTLLAGLNIAI